MICTVVAADRQTERAKAEARGWETSIGTPASGSTRYGYAVDLEQEDE